MKNPDSFNSGESEWQERKVERAHREVIITGEASRAAGRVARRSVLMTDRHWRTDKPTQNDISLGSILQHQLTASTLVTNLTTRHHRLDTPPTLPTRVTLERNRTSVCDKNRGEHHLDWHTSLSQLSSGTSRGSQTAWICSRFRHWGGAKITGIGRVSSPCSENCADFWSHLCKPEQSPTIQRDNPWLWAPLMNTVTASVQRSRVHDARTLQAIAGPRAQRDDVCAPRRDLPLTRSGRTVERVWRMPRELTFSFHSNANHMGQFPK